MIRAKKSVLLLCLSTFSSAKTLKKKTPLRKFKLTWLNSVKIWKLTLPSMRKKTLIEKKLLKKLKLIQMIPVNNYRD